MLILTQEHKEQLGRGERRLAEEGIYYEELVCKIVTAGHSCLEANNWYYNWKLFPGARVFT